MLVWAAGDTALWDSDPDTRLNRVPTMQIVANELLSRVNAHYSSGEEATPHITRMDFAAAAIFDRIGWKLRDRK